MITKRINTDMYLNLLFKDKLTGQNINYSGANDIRLELKRRSSSLTQWKNQTFTLTDDGVIHFQWNADENVNLGIYDARISFYKISSASENGKIQYRFDAISLFQIVPTSDDENIETDTTNTINISVSWGGFDGMSAYEIAVKYGYVGSEEDYAKIESNNSANEVIRQTNESSRVSNEIARNNAESARVTAEGQRSTNEGSRQTNESSRVLNEIGRNNAESDRVAAEGQRSTNEGSRQTNESSRVLNEIARNNAESARVAAEGQRSTNEGSRQTNESSRVSNEIARNNAESARVTAEGQRKTEFDSIKQGIESLTPTTVYFKID